MGINKRYYWLKLKKDFFTEKRVKKLRSIAGGDTFTIIYLKMQLMSLADEGQIYFEHVEETFAEELALVIDEDVKNVEMTVNYLMGCGLLQEVEQDIFLLPEVLECIGSETQSTERSRNCRERKKLEQQKALQCNTLATNCNTEIDKDKEIEKEIDKDKEIDIEKENKPQKRQYAEFVHMLDEEYDKLTTSYGEDFTKECIEVLDNYKGSKGKTYKSDYRAILSWVVTEVNKRHSSDKKSKDEIKNPFLDILRKDGKI